MNTFLTTKGQIGQTGQRGIRAGQSPLRADNVQAPSSRRGEISQPSFPPSRRGDIAQVPSTVSSDPRPSRRG